MSCPRPSNASSRVSGPWGPASLRLASTSTMGRRRRAAAIASPSRVCAFSRTRNVSSSACHEARSTTGGRAAALPAGVADQLFFESLLIIASMLGIRVFVFFIPDMDDSWPRRPVLLSSYRRSIVDNAKLRATEAVSVLRGNHTEYAQKRSPHCLGAAESGMLSDRLDRRRPRLHHRPCRFHTNPFYESRRCDAGLGDEKPRQVALAHRGSLRESLHAMVAGWICGDLVEHLPQDRVRWHRIGEAH